VDRVKVGIVGCGYWGPNLIRNFVELPSSNVVAVADLRAERLTHISNCYPQIQCTTDYRELFDRELDAVVVATPPATHYSVARECLEHGLHVLVEKPMTLSSRDAEELTNLAERCRLNLMVGHTLVYNPAVRALKAAIASGELGHIYYIDCVRVNLGLLNAHSSVLWDLAPHDLSFLQFLLDCDPVSVSAVGAACIFDGAHDIVYIHLTFPNGVLANIHISWLDPRKVRRFTIVGSKKMAVFDDVDPLEKIRIYDKGVETPSYTETYGDFQCSYRYGNVVIPNIRLAEPLKLECQDFIDSIINRTEPESSGRCGLRVVRVLEAADRSLHNDGRVEVIDGDQAGMTSYTAPMAQRDSRCTNL
jgi:predicted dehydrogenase